MKRQNDIAKAYAMALKINAISLKQVIAWSDTIIEKDLEPSFDIVDLSCSKNINDAVSTLNVLAEDADDDTSIRIFFGLCYESLKNGVANYSDVVNRLYFWYIEESDYSKYSEVCHFSDDLYLAIHGVYGNPETIKQEILDFLNKNKLQI